TYTRDLAAALRRLVAARRFGTVHLTNSGTCSWFELAVATVELAGLPATVTPVSSDRLERRAARPSWSVLDGTHAAALGIGPLPHWRDGLTRLLEELGERAG
ncbi:MAG: sugar nucleotide-binding protein, partial [Nitriliruptoraceae bacterium]